MILDIFGRTAYRVPKAEYDNLYIQYEEKQGELALINTLLTPFDGLRQDETVLEKVRSARDIIIADRAIIQQHARDIDSLQGALDDMAFLLGNAQKEAADKETEIRRLKEAVDALNTQGIRLLAELAQASTLNTALRQQQEMLTTTAPKKPTKRTTVKK